jgi:hypothetical protein
MAKAQQSRRLPIVWEGVIVGWMENPFVENWFHEGKWIPAENDTTERFLEHLEQTGEALVILGDRKGRVHEPVSEESIWVKSWPGLEW